ncbi:HET-domain-containing protein [Hyaloscypha hepaticicola]|uniref:HET-domain-containing protein n=1 Tax=Hyaloscypha hepaticicola TaxID=2082293 RepID=A0A2J6QJJ5_9HELO|nr:HET-domain-containing protein [Hyaloscypha hepaticicola]
MLIQNWLSCCVEQHPKCKPTTVARKLPKRLLHVCSFDDSDDIRLVESETILDKAEYVALSHCWGPPEKQPLRTTRCTLVDRQQRIRFVDLPLTFQDAVKICRNINQQFLWIDSLCIVQDDSDDWAEQASEMASIYGCSYVTLAALSSEDGTQGCRIRQRPRYKGILSHYQDFDIDTYCIRCFDSWPASWQYEYGDGVYRSEDFGTNPLRKRAWTLQERELPVRSVHFSQGQLLWQCRTMRGSSELPWTTTEEEDDDDSPPALVIYRDQEEYHDLEFKAYQRNRWFQLIEDYSSRHLTKEMDRLPALAGLADDFAQMHQDGDCEYLAGIWSSHLPSALLWNSVASRPRRPQAYRAPSWSWASLEGASSYDSQRLSNERLQDQSESGFPFKVISWDCPPIEAFQSLNNSFRAVLRVRGSLAKLRIGLQLTEDKGSNTLHRLSGEDGETMGVFFPDCPEDLTGLDVVYVLSIDFDLYTGLIPCPIELDWESRTFCSIGLALLRDEPADTYRRVGLARWLLKKAYEATTPVELDIV